MKLNISSFIALVLFLAFGLGATKCANQKPTIALLLRGFAIACDAAAPFAGPYAPFILMGAEAAQAGANELSTAQPLPVQLSKLLTELSAVANQAPQLQNADPNTKAKIQAVEDALQAVIILVQQMQASQPKAGAMSAHATPAKPLPLTENDRKALAEVSGHVAHVRLLLAQKPSK